MTLAFYMDVNIPRAISDGLRARDVDVLTAQEDGAGRMADKDLLDRASALNRIVFTHDQDFLREAEQRQSKGIPFAGVIFVRQERVSIGECVSDLELAATVGQSAELANRVEFLPLRSRGG